MIACSPQIGLYSLHLTPHEHGGEGSIQILPEQPENETVSHDQQRLDVKAQKGRVPIAC